MLYARHALAFRFATYPFVIFTRWTHLKVICLWESRITRLNWNTAQLWFWTSNLWWGGSFSAGRKRRVSKF